jgi:hypothetical protein
VVDYTCGYGDDEEAVPGAVKLYILSKLIEQYDPPARSQAGTVQSKFNDRLLASCKVYG